MFEPAQEKRVLIVKGVNVSDEFCRRRVFLNELFQNVFLWIPIRLYFHTLLMLSENALESLSIYGCSSVT